MGKVLGNKRGQAGIEFLTTYGWAILAVIIVVGALSYFDVLDTKRFVSEECQIGSQVECMEVFLNDEGDVQFLFKNNYAVDITVVTVYIGEKKLFPENKNISSGDNYTFQGYGVVKLSGVSKERINVRIVFKRSGINTKEYNLTGVAVAKVYRLNDVSFPVFESCGNGSLDPNEDCGEPPNNLQSKSCYEINPSIYVSGTAICRGCEWDTNLCILQVPDFCGNGVVDTSEGEVCDFADSLTESKACIAINQNVYVSGTAYCDATCKGYDKSTCKLKCTDASDCTNAAEPICVGVNQGEAYGVCESECSVIGARCSNDATSFNEYGICVIGYGAHKVCANFIAVMQESNYYGSCSFVLSPNLGEGLSCDPDSLSDGFNSNGATCQNGVCTPLGPSNSCTTGDYCKVHSPNTPVCVSGTCVAGCNNSNVGQNCSNTTAGFTNYGICVLDSYPYGTYFCDDNIALVKGTYYLDSCSSVPVSISDGSTCDPDSLSGGFNGTGICHTGFCELQVLCTGGNECASGLCVGGHCAPACDYSLNQGLGCSYNSAVSYSSYGVCEGGSCIKNCMFGSECTGDINKMCVDGKCRSNCYNYPGSNCSDELSTVSYVDYGVCASSICKPRCSAGGAMCAYGLCVDGFCEDTCDNFNGKQCIYPVGSIGICTNTTNPSTRGDCDLDVAVNVTMNNINKGLFGNCVAGNSYFVNMPCDHDGLSDGFNPTGLCSTAGTCVESH